MILEILAAALPGVYLFGRHIICNAIIDTPQPVKIPIVKEKLLSDLEQLFISLMQTDDSWVVNNSSEKLGVSYFTHNEMINNTYNIKIKFTKYFSPIRNNSYSKVFIYIKTNKGWEEVNCSNSKVFEDEFKAYTARQEDSRKAQLAKELANRILQSDKGRNSFLGGPEGYSGDWGYLYPQEEFSIISSINKPRTKLLDTNYITSEKSIRK